MGKLSKALCGKGPGVSLPLPTLGLDNDAPPSGPSGWGVPLRLAERYGDPAGQPWARSPPDLHLAVGREACEGH